MRNPRKATPSLMCAMRVLAGDSRRPIGASTRVTSRAGRPARARAYYDARRAAGDTHHQALRALGNRLVGVLHGCLTSHAVYSEKPPGPTASILKLPRPLDSYSRGMSSRATPNDTEAPFGVVIGAPKRHLVSLEPWVTRRLPAPGGACGGTAGRAGAAGRPGCRLRAGPA